MADATVSNVDPSTEIKELKIATTEPVEVLFFYNGIFSVKLSENATSKSNNAKFKFVKTSFVNGIPPLNFETEHPEKCPSEFLMACKNTYTKLYVSSTVACVSAYVFDVYNK